MYSLVSAIAKSFQTQGRWVSVDITDLTFAQLFSDYTAVIATLTNPFVTGQVGLRLSAIQAQVGDSGQTFSEFLTANGNLTLPTFAPIPTINPKYVRYMDVFRAGYDVTPVGPTQAPDAQIPEGDKTWLFLTKTDPVTDYTLFYKTCLVSVNGFIHRLDASTQGVWVMDGNKSSMLSGRAEMGILDFQDVSQFEILPITPAMIYKQASGQLYQNQVRINTGVDLSTKTPMLVLGGYLHMLDSKTFRRIGQTQLLIDFNNLPFIERYHESRECIDYSSMPFQTTTRNDAQISVPDFLSDANILAYLQLSQSFLVMLDNLDVYRDSIYVEKSGMVGKLVAHGSADNPPDKPLVNGIGKLADYWYVYEDQQYSLNVVDNFWQRRKYKTVPLLQQNGVDDGRQPQDPVRHSRAYFLVIGTDLATTTTT